MNALRLPGWTVAPRLGLVMPAGRAPGWFDAAFWAAQLDAWGLRAERFGPKAPAAALARCTTLIVPSAAIDPGLAESLRSARGARTTLLVAGPAPGMALDGEDAPKAGGVVRFEVDAAAIDWRTTLEAVDAAERALADAAPRGLVGLWRWPGGKDAVLVVDGDVDHPTGIDPECSRYVAPAIETARRAGFRAYGIFAAAANVDAEPASFPPAAGYYNHSYTHPYSHWNPAPWDSLEDSEMEKEILRSREAFRRELGVDDEGIFRLPHFQLEASDRTYAVLDRLGYRADSSVGANWSITGGLPFHPAVRDWSGHPADRAHFRSHPDPAGHRRILQLPISTDPTDPGFPNGCCSYNTLEEGVRSRTANPSAYEAVLQEVLDSAVGRRGLAHLFIDPPDAGYGRLPGDRPDYASAVERWMRRAVERDELAILTTAGLTTWWSEREAAIGRLSWRVEGGDLLVDAVDVPAGTALAALPPREGELASWERIPIASR